MAGRAASIGNVEALVKSRQRVCEDDDELDGVDEAVEAGLLMEPSRLGYGDAIIRHSRAEGRAKSEQAGAEDHEEELVAHASSTKLFDALAAGDDEAEGDDGDGEECQEGKVGQGNDLDVVGLVDGRLVKRVDAVDDGDDEHDEAGHDGDVDGAKDDFDGQAPAETRVVGPEDAQDEDHVDDEDEQDARVGEDLGGEADAAVFRVAGPDDAHDVCGDAGHGEAEEEAGEDELVAAAAVALEDCHVEGGGADEEEEDNGGDGDVDVDGWGEAEACVFGGVRGTLGRKFMLVWLLMIFYLKGIVVMVMVLRGKGGDKHTMFGGIAPLWPLDAIFSDEILFLIN